MDVYNPKPYRYHGRHRTGETALYFLPELIASLEDIPVYGTFLDGENMYTQPLSAYGLIVMGNEGNGIGDEVKRLIKPETVHSQLSGRTRNFRIFECCHCYRSSLCRVPAAGSNVVVSKLGK